MIVGTTATSFTPITTTAADAKAAGNGGNDFMLLLLAEMRNQNPLDPVKDKDFMSQLTQMNSYLELQKMNATLLAANKASTLTQAASLIGKTVTYPGDYGPESGLVTSVEFEGDNVQLVLGNRAIPLSAVSSVAPGPVAAPVVNAVGAV